MSDLKRLLHLKHNAISSIRSSFQSEGIGEVVTPLLVTSPAIEPYIDPVAVQLSNRAGRPLYLPTSPEISIKKIFPYLYDHLRGVYEISHAFRSEITGPLHRHEFIMVEWYLRDATIQTLWDSFGNFIDSLVSDDLSRPVDQPYQKVSVEINTRRVSVAELFYSGFGESPAPDWGFREYAALARKAGFSFEDRHVDSGGGLVSLFSLMFDHLIENHLFASKDDRPEQKSCTLEGRRDLVYIYQYPPFLRGMARLDSEGWAGRTEAFIDGIEVASGYQELADPEELRRVWEKNNQIRVSEGKEPHQIDHSMLASLESIEGVSGIAAGLERTLMALYKTGPIENFFPSHLF